MNFPQFLVGGMTAIVILLAVVLIAPKVAGQSQIESPHHFQLSCDGCHEIKTNDTPAKDAASQAAPQKTIGRVNRDVNRTCTQSSCHYFPDNANHPVGVVPSGTVPENLPLDRQRRITCITCHDETKKNKTGPGEKYFLRTQTGNGFCVSCHTKMNGTLKQQAHWQFTSRAHLKATDYTLNASVRDDFQRDALGVDRESRTCLSCHDDVNAVVPANSGPWRKSAQGNMRMTDHPIGMDYNKYLMDARRGFRSSPDVRLFEGKVGCGSCHNLYNKKEKHLVASFRAGGILCKKCHNK